MAGDPTSSRGCSGYECIVDDDCSDQQSCMGHRCQDPCPGSCGVNANCRCEKHHPVCTCNHGLTGNPLTRCYPVNTYLPTDPCLPSPCGLNTLCQVLNGRPVCSCQTDFIGDPQFGCHPECVLNTDCPLNKACINRHCTNPCTIGGICGLNALCQVEDHTATCICNEGFTGDAFSQCIPRRKYLYKNFNTLKFTEPFLAYPTANTTKPCRPSPCGPQTECNVYGTEVAVCDPCMGPNAAFNPQCRPECLTSADCPFDKACISQVCADPCPGSCGINAICTTVIHSPVCSCPRGLMGNPFEHCAPQTISKFII